jgi:hypothetical protein
MVLNEYRLEIQFKKVWKVRNINNIPMVRSRPLECRPAQNGLYMVFELVQILVRSQILSRLLCNSCSHYIITLYLYNNCDYFILTHPVNFHCGRKPERPEKTHDFRQSVDWLFSHESVARIGEPMISEVKGACSDDCVTQSRDLRELLLVIRSYPRLTGA